MTSPPRINHAGRGGRTLAAFPVEKVESAGIPHRCDARQGLAPLHPLPNPDVALAFKSPPPPVHPGGPVGSLARRPPAGAPSASPRSKLLAKKINPDGETDNKATGPLGER